MPFALGGMVGYVVGSLARFGKVRNLAVTFVIVAIVTLIAYYFAWVFWIKATLARAMQGEGVPAMDLITAPGLMWEIIGDINKNGTWSLKRSEPVSGWFLTLIWLAEAVIIFGTAFVGAAASVGDAMYCETCDRWTPLGTQIRRTAPGDPATARQRLEAHDFAWIDTLPPDPEGSNAWWSFTHRRCPTCENLHSLSLIQTAMTADNKGNITTTTTKVVDSLLITPQEAQALLAAASPAPPAPPAPPPPPSSTPSEPDDAA
jgi:hypothetical protein